MTYDGYRRGYVSFAHFLLYFKQKLRRRAWSLSHEIFRKAAHYVEEQNS